MANTPQDKNNEVLSVLRKLQTEEIVETESRGSSDRGQERDVQRAQLRELKTIANIMKFIVALIILQIVINFLSNLLQ